LNVSEIDRAGSEVMPEKNGMTIWAGMARQVIGSTYTIAALPTATYVPVLEKALHEQSVLTGHVCRFAEGASPCFFGWPICPISHGEVF